MRGRAAAVLAVAGIVVAAGLFAVTRDGDGEGGTGDPGDTAPLPTALAGYRITYRVEVTIDGPERSRREVAILRPFSGSDVTIPEGREDAATGLVATAGHLYRLEPGKAVDFGEQGPAPAPGDLHPGPQLEWLERLGLARPAGTATVAGRDCRRFRFGAPLADGFRVPQENEYADVCLDGDGLLLEELWYLDGRLVRRTEATSVDPTPPRPDAFGLGGREVTPAVASSFSGLPAGRTPDTGQPYWSAERPPFGLRHQARYRQAPLDPASGLPAPGGVVHADAYLAGGHLVRVEHREEAVLEPPRGAGQRVDAGRLGEAWLWLTPQGPEIRAAGSGQVVVVRATFDPDRLLVFARSLRPAGGGE